MTRSLSCLRPLQEHVIRAKRAAVITLLACTLGVAVGSLGFAQEATIPKSTIEPDIRPINFPHLEEMDLTAEAWTISVPENRERADSRMIKLVFARLKSTSPNPGPPLVYLAGGPGQGASGAIASPETVAAFRPLLELGDVIWLDQRGTGRSQPNLAFAQDKPIPSDAFASEQNLKQLVLEAAQAGAEHFRAQDVDLTGYTTAQSADDLEDMRQALSVDKLNLLGFSYGTHLALATIKRHPESLANVVVVGVEGLDHTFKQPRSLETQFAKLGLMVEQDPGLSMTADEFAELVERVFAKLDAEPMIVTLRDPQTGGELQMPVGKFALQLFMRFDVGDRSDLVVFPRLLHSIDQGDPSVLSWFAQKRLSLLRGLSLMTLVMDPASGASPERMQMIEAQAARSPFGNIVNFPFYPELNEILNTPDLGDEFRAPLATDVRTLFLTGTLDWNTPPYQAEEVRWGFTNATHITVKNAGHEQVLPQLEIQQAIVQFLSGNEVGDTELSLPPLRFVPLEGSGDVSHPAVR